MISAKSWFSPSIAESLGAFFSRITSKSLTNRDFIVKRRGEGFDTTYTLNPVTNDEGDSVKTPLTDADKELAEKKEDLSAKVAHKPIEDWGKQSSGKKDEKKDEESGETDASKSPFLNRNRGAAATEDE